MAKFITPQSNLLNQLNGKNMRNLQRYQTKIIWQLDANETFKSARIVDESVTKIPKGLSKVFTSNSLTLSGLPEDVDLYHPVLKTYLYSGFQLDGTEYRTEVPNDLNKATLDDIKNQDMHYTGKSWGNKGIAGYYKDGHTLKFNFQVEVQYYWNPLLITNTNTASSRTSSQRNTKTLKKLIGNFTITCVPNMQPKIFCYKYGQANGFVDENGNKIGYDEYAENMRKKGFDFLTIDLSRP